MVNWNWDFSDIECGIQPE